MSDVHLDIENAKTKKVDTLVLKIIERTNDYISFDISNLNSEELNKLKDAINNDLFYTDIELFYIDESNTPYYGPDFIFEIKNNILIANIRPSRKNLYKI